MKESPLEERRDPRKRKIMDDSWNCSQAGAFAAIDMLNAASV
jgi:hypothetical protein